jgi:hypothetical protein
LRAFTPPPRIPASAVPSPRQIQAQLAAEDLKLLDTFVIGEIKAWVRDELPALVVREIGKLNERLCAEAIAHLHATLLPRISEHIAEQIDKLEKPEPC